MGIEGGHRSGDTLRLKLTTYYVHLSKVQVVNYEETGVSYLFSLNINASSNQFF